MHILRKCQISAAMFKLRWKCRAVRSETQLQREEMIQCNHQLVKDAVRLQKHLTERNRRITVLEAENRLNYRRVSELEIIIHDIQVLCYR